jgi:hypothetical protein
MNGSNYKLRRKLISRLRMKRDEKINLSKTDTITKECLFEIQSIKKTRDKTFRR